MSDFIYNLKKNIKEQRKLAFRAVKTVAPAVIRESSQNFAQAFSQEAKAAFRTLVLKKPSPSQSWNDSPSKGIQIVSTRRPEYWQGRGYNTFG